MKELRNQAVLGTFAGIMERAITLLLQFGAQFIMMRKLSPAVYGQIGILNIFIGVSMIFIDSGLGNALIQKNDVEEKDYSTAFFLNMIMAIACYLLIFCGSTTIASFYDDSELVMLIKVMGLNLFFCAIGMVPQAILFRELKFKCLARLSIISGLLSSAIGVSLAYLNCGVWSVAAQLTSMYLFRSFLMIWESKWLPILTIDKNSFKSLFGFCSKMLISNLLDQIFANLNVSIVGKYFKTQVGYFSQGNKFSQLFFNAFATPIHTVTMSTMSAAQHRSDQFQPVFKKFIQTAAILTFPIVLGLVAVTDSGFRILFSEVWMPVVPIFRWLCGSGLLLTIYIINQNVLKSYGRTDLLLFSNVIRKTILLILLLVGLRWGVVGILIGGFVSSILDFFINAYFTWLTISVSVLSQFLYIWRILLLSAVVFGLVMLCDLLKIRSDFLMVLLKTIVGLTFYICGAFLFCRESFSGACSVATTLLPKLSTTKKPVVVDMA